MDKKDFIKTKVGEAIFNKIQEDKHFQPTIYEVKSTFKGKNLITIIKIHILFKVSFRR